MKMALSRIITKKTSLVQFLASSPAKAWQQTMASSTFALKKIEANSTKPLTGENFEDKNKRLARPVSPHLSIYKFEQNMAMSISHRFTGVAQNGMLYGLAIGAMVLPASFPYYLGLLQAAHMPALVLAGKFIIAFPFSYHLINGMRHLIWDCGTLLTIKGIYATGYAVFALAIALTAYLCSL